MTVIVMESSWLLALAGGALIGAASALLLVTHGRIAGISGILGALLPPRSQDRAWRAWFVAGMLVTGAIGSLVHPSAFGDAPRSLPPVVVAGVLVGFGTRLGNGCTSGHGVCGIARLSRRSAVAVATFMATGVITAWLAGGLT